MKNPILPIFVIISLFILLLNYDSVSKGLGSYSPSIQEEEKVIGVFYFRYFSLD